jgi:hypothetical protein
MGSKIFSMQPNFPMGIPQIFHFMGFEMDYGFEISVQTPFFST